MEYSRKQKQLDVKKWVDSEIKGYDTCGAYDYCSSCNKSEKHPCAHAYETYTALSNLKTSTTTAKTTTKKATASKSATTAKKATTCKSTTTAKKTTCKRTTTKKATAEAC